MPLNISNFSLFLQPLKKFTPSYQGPPFWKFGRRFNSPPSRKGERTLCNCLPLTLPPSVTRFSPGLFVVLQEILYQPFFLLIRLLQKIMHFQSKTNFFFQLIAGRFWFCYFVNMFFLGHFLTFLPSWNYEYLYICIYPQLLVWPLIKSCVTTKE